MDQELTNPEIAVYALYKLGGAERKIHTERVAELCYRLAGAQFSWRLKEFSFFPDKDIARIALYDAAKEKYGHLTEGRAGVGAVGKEADGWTLTAKGVKWILENEQRVAKQLGEQAGPSVRRGDAQKIRKRFTGNPVYARFLKEGSLDSVTPYEITDMLDCSPDAPPSIVQKRFERFRAEGILLQDTKINAFLDRVAERLPAMTG